MYSVRESIHRSFKYNVDSSVCGFEHFFNHFKVAFWNVFVGTQDSGAVSDQTRLIQHYSHNWSFLLLLEKKGWMYLLRRRTFRSVFRCCNQPRPKRPFGQISYLRELLSLLWSSAAWQKATGILIALSLLFKRFKKGLKVLWPISCPLLCCSKWLSVMQRS